MRSRGARLPAYGDFPFQHLAVDGKVTSQVACAARFRRRAGEPVQHGFPLAGRGVLLAYR